MEFPPDGGEMAALIRSHDWSQTSLGPISTWPACLRTAVSLMLPAHAQIVMFWGPEFLAFYNDAYAPTIGDKHPRALGRPACESWSELWSDLEPLLRRVLDTGETVSAQDRPFYIERHGYPEQVYFDISYSPLRDETGTVRGVFCIVSETTRRVLARHALRESEERLRAVFEQATGGIALTDTTGRFALVNECFREIVGYQEAELLGMRMQDITHPDDLKAEEALFGKLVGDGDGYTIEKRYVRKDGTLVWVSNSVGPIRDETGKVRQASAMVIDINRRKLGEEAERRLAAIIASSYDAILSTDLDMRITSWNQGAEHLYGYGAEEAIGRLVTMLVPPDRPDEETLIIESIRRGERVEPHETIRLRKNGSAVDVSLTVSPVCDEHGRIVGASKIARDITGRKETERLQRALMDEMKHRVKNILATVQAIARQTFGGHLDTEAASAAFDARLLSLSRAHDLLTRERWDGADLATVVAEVLAPYPRDRFEIGGPPLKLSPRLVLAMSLALHELATNAAKYGALSVQTGRIAIAWTVRPGTPDRVELRWRERGGPLVSPPKRRGFGSRLIEGVLAAELNGAVRLGFEPEGIVCDVVAPIEGGWEEIGG